MRSEFIYLIEYATGKNLIPTQIKQQHNTAAMLELEKPEKTASSPNMWKL